MASRPALLGVNRDRAPTVPPGVRLPQDIEGVGNCHIRTTTLEPPRTPFRAPAPTERGEDRCSGQRTSEWLENPPTCSSSNLQLHGTHGRSDNRIEASDSLAPVSTVQYDDKTAVLADQKLWRITEQVEECKQGWCNARCAPT